MCSSIKFYTAILYSSHFKLVFRSLRGCDTSQVLHPHFIFSSYLWFHLFFSLFQLLYKIKFGRIFCSKFVSHHLLLLPFSTKLFTSRVSVAKIINFSKSLSMNSRWLITFISILPHSLNPVLSLSYTTRRRTHKRKTEEEEGISEINPFLLKWREWKEREKYPDDERKLCNESKRERKKFQFFPPFSFHNPLTYITFFPQRSQAFLSVVREREQKNPIKIRIFPH